MSKLSTVAAGLVKVMLVVVGIVLLPLGLFFGVWFNFGGLPERLSGLPGISKGGGFAAGAIALMYGLFVIGLVGGAGAAAADLPAAQPSSAPDPGTPTATATATPTATATESDDPTLTDIPTPTPDPNAEPVKNRVETQWETRLTPPVWEWEEEIDLRYVEVDDNDTIHVVINDSTNNETAAEQSDRIWYVYTQVVEENEQYPRMKLWRYQPGQDNLITEYARPEWAVRYNTGEWTFGDYTSEIFFNTIEFDSQESPPGNTE